MSSINPLIQSSETKENSSIDVELETSETAANTRKNSPFLNPTSDASNELIHLLLNELKEMRMEIKEMKEDGKENKKSLEGMEKNQMKLQEDVCMMKAVQDDQKESLREMKKSLKEMEVNQKNHQEEVRNVQNNVTGIEKSLEHVQREQQNQEQSLHECNGNISLNQKKTEKEPELNSQEDIRRRINGKWRNVQNDIMKTKFENDIFMIQHYYDDCFTRYKIGVEHKDDYTTSIENNKIVIRDFTNQGEEESREEYYIESERLHQVHYYLGTEYFREIYERLEGPDS